MLFAVAKSYLNILRSKIFHICPWANISRGEAVFHPTESDFTHRRWISLKTRKRFPRAEVRYRASFAFRALCAADLAPKLNKAVAKVGLLVFGYRLGEYFFHSRGVFQRFGIEAESAADADAMRVGNYGVDAENVTEEEVCYLPSNARKC